MASISTGYRPVPLPETCRGHFTRTQSRFPAGHVLVLPHEHTSGIYLVFEGCVRLFVANANGEEKTVRFIPPGDVFGDAYLFLGTTFGMTAMTWKASCVGFLENEEALRLCRDEPEFALWCMRHLSWMLWSFGHQIADLALEDRVGKVARSIALLAREFGNRISESSYSVRISQRELADFAHVSRPNVSKALNQLERAGLIRKWFCHIVIPDLHLLYSHCNI